MNTSTRVEGVCSNNVYYTLCFSTPVNSVPCYFNCFVFTTKTENFGPPAMMQCEGNDEQAWSET